jgi:molybdate transport system substrate-binding protein
MQKTASLVFMSSIATREALRELVPVFEKERGCKVTLQFAGGVDVVRRLKAGETGMDVVSLSASAIEDLAQAGVLAAGSRVDFASSTVGVAVRAGAPRPGLGSGEAVKRAVLAAKSIAISSGPSGVYLQGLFDRWGIAREKLVQSKPGMAAGEVVARGEAEIGFQQLSELLPVKGIDFLGPLPQEIQHRTVFSGGVHAKSAHTQVARELLKFLASPAAAPVLRAKGMEPAG